MIAPKPLHGRAAHPSCVLLHRTEGCLLDCLFLWAAFGFVFVRYTAEDHTALAASGILEAVSAVLTASHVKRQLVQARSELLSGGGVSEAEADVIVRAATEKALYSPWCGARLPLPRERTARLFLVLLQPLLAHLFSTEVGAVCCRYGTHAQLRMQPSECPLLETSRAGPWPLSPVRGPWAWCAP
jgi:hypothetical protein